MNGNMRSALLRPPFIKHPDNVRTIMADVLIALVPAVLWSVYAFGYRALVIIAVSVLTAVTTETAYDVIAKKYITIGDLSAVITGLLLALSLPAAVPLYVPVLGSFFAVGIVKCVFGGLGGNFLNPALSGFVFLKLTFSEAMGLFRIPFTDTVTSATPLVYLKEGILPEQTLYDIITGNVAGSIGEISSLLIFAGGMYLLVRGIISWHIPTAFIATVTALVVFFTQNVSAVSFAISEVFSGGLLLGAFFMATDPVTTPITNVGKLIFGVICGGATVLLRYFGGGVEGVAYAILIANLFVGIIDKVTLPSRFGGKPIVVMSNGGASNEG